MGSKILPKVDVFLFLLCDFAKTEGMRVFGGFLMISFWFIGLSWWILSPRGFFF